MLNAFVVFLGVVLLTQIVIGVTQVAIVRDAVIMAYRQLWREQMAAVMLREKDLADTPPAHDFQGPA